MFTKKVVQWFPEPHAPRHSNGVETNVFMNSEFLQTFPNLEDAAQYARLTWRSNHSTKPFIQLVPINVVVK